MSDDLTTRQRDWEFDRRTELEGLLSSIWLYVPWVHVTKQLTTGQKELWADAIDAHHARMNANEPHVNLSPVERWWRQ